MPTLRLGDQERSSIRRSFKKTLERCKHNQPIPLEDSDFPEFGYAMLPDNVALHYSELRKDAEHGLFLTSSSSWHPDFKVCSDNLKYNITITGDPVELPVDGLTLPYLHPKHAELLAWAENYYRVSESVSKARFFMTGMVENCSSTGQLKRLLPKDILRFLPEHMMSYFGQAERQSRIPAAMDMSDFTEKMENLMQMLALGSLSPEEVVGNIDAVVDRRIPI